MSDGFLRQVDALVTAAASEDRSFGTRLTRVMRESRNHPPAVLESALPRIGEGIAAAPPNLGSWLAIAAAVWAEHGTAPSGADDAVLYRAADVAATSAAFAGAWHAATGLAPPPDPSQRVVDTLAGHHPDPVAAMLAWSSLERFALSAHTMLSLSPRLRQAPDRDRVAELMSGLSEHCVQAVWVATLLRVLDGERLLVLDRATRRGWTVSVGGIADTFQLHMLLAGALLGRASGMPGTPPDLAVLASFRNADAPDASVTAPWTLTDAHGHPVDEEGVPADIPEISGTRVLVLDDPPSAPRAYPAGRQHPLMAAHLTVEGIHEPDELSAWWTHIT